MDETDFMHFFNYDDARLILRVIEMATDKGCYFSMGYDANDRYFNFSFDKTPIDEKEEA